MKRLNCLFCLALIISFTKAQNIYTYAGTGIPGYSGDGAAATSAQMKAPEGVAIDALGNMYIADYPDNRIRKINTSGIISAIAGTGVQGYSGDGGLATVAKLSTPKGVAIDASGNVYIADAGNNRIRKINTSGIISTFAGSGIPGFGGDGAAATFAQLNDPVGVAVDVVGNVYIADATNNRIRKVNTSGIISTFAGTGLGGYSGDGGAATSAALNNPTGATVDASGNVYIVDIGNSRIRKVNTSGIISTFAGTTTAGYSGDGGPANNAQLNLPTGATIDASGNIYIADGYNQRVRKVNTSGIISTIAGTGVAGYSGDGASATNAKLNSPSGLALDASGNLFIADLSNSRVREICITSCALNINSITKIDRTISIFPNPSNGQFKIELDDALINESQTLEIFDGLGNKIYSTQMHRSKMEIDLGKYSKGVYLVKLNSNSGVISKRIVIE